MVETNVGHRPAMAHIRDLVLTDEHSTIAPDASLKDGTKALLEVPGSVLIVLDDGKVKGVLGTMQVLKSVAEGADLSSLTCGDIMDMDVMEVNADALVSEVLKDINERQPQAVVAVDDKGSFTGYFSPNDYRQAMTKVDDNPAIRALE